MTALRWLNSCAEDAGFCLATPINNVSSGCWTNGSGRIRHLQRTSSASATVIDHLSGPVTPNCMSCDAPQVTLAMEAGIADHVWEIEELVWLLG